MIFSNYKQVGSNYERRLLLELADFGIKGVLPEELIKKSLNFKNNELIIKDKKFNLKNKRIFVIGAGKMSGEMAVELEKIIGQDKITYGIINTNFIKNKPKKIIINKANHPIPSLDGYYGAKKILEIKKKFNLNKNDFIIALISGGGSSLLPYPIDEISFEDKKNMIIELIKSGANSHEITTLKKKVSNVKGGKLAEYFYPIPILSLVVSDVVGDNLDVIASGPLTKDNSTFKDALNIIKKYNLENKIAMDILKFIIRKKDVSEKQDLSNVEQFLLANNETIIKTIKDYAESLGLTVVINKNIQGESRIVARNICNKLNNTKIDRPTLFIYGGETTVTLKKEYGKGGRNQEFIVSCLKYFDYKKFNHHKWAIASISSDGVDFIEESCGGIIDKGSFERLRKHKIDINKFLDNHDSYYLLKKINSNLSTNGLTGVNVADVMLFLFV